MKRVFGHGGLRLFLLMLLDEQPRHGYELIRLVEDRFLGMYTPSAGTIYPRLSSLEEEGLVEHEEVDGRKIYRLTDAGRQELHDRKAELAELQERAAESARQMAGAIRAEVRDSVRELREELRHTMRDVRRQDRRAGRRSEAEGRGSRHARPGSRLGLQALRADLDAFCGDILAAAEATELRADTVKAVRDALLDAREAVVAVFNAPPAY
ncbi:MAG TPA: PadR family transcriptional regulator [Acidimicrobiales bacterium]|nr:PadR family transcriptional regulator [Acidimicrobiales bacterium]